MNKSIQRQNRLKAMQKEILKISTYRALIISRFYMSICLAISFFLLVFSGYSEAAFYILLIVNLMPAILSYIIKDFAARTQKTFLTALIRESPFLLDTLKKKYNYTKLRNFTNSVSYITALLLLLLWQYSYPAGGLPAYLLFLPTGILMSSALLRILGIPFIYWKLHFDLSYNRI